MGRSDTFPLRLRVLGPAGAWRVVTREGIASLSAGRGRIGDTITVTAAAGRDGDFSLGLEYRGVATISGFGERSPAGVAVRFGWARHLPRTTWHVRFVALDSVAATPSDTTAVRALLSGIAASELDTSRLDLMWYRPPRKEIPQARLLTEARAVFEVAAGRYLLRTIADDAVRVFMDGRLLLDDWTPGESRVKEASLALGGRHEVRVEHLQLGGWYELRVDLESASKPDP